MNAHLSIVVGPRKEKGEIFLISEKFVLRFVCAFFGALLILLSRAYGEWACVHETKTGGAGGAGSLLAGNNRLTGGEVQSVVVVVVVLRYLW